MLFCQHNAIASLLFWLSTLLLANCCSLLPAVAIADENSVDLSTPNSMLLMLQQRVLKQPEHSDTWRLIGKLKRQDGELQEAIEANQEALRLDPLNVAAHFDMGELLGLTGNPQQSQAHFQQVLSIAPESGYAKQVIGNQATRKGLTTGDVNSASQIGATLDDPGGQTIQPVSHEIQTFDNKLDFDRRIDRVLSDTLPVSKRLRLSIEAGGLYNSNVSLTPISRELAQSEAASFQGTLNPDIEWTAIKRPNYRLGTLGRGYFSVNEDQWTAFNLASFQPGFFAERSFQIGEHNLVGRVDYVYSLDLLAGDSFGDRHSIMTSLLSISPELDVFHIYVLTAASNFAADGTDPTVESLDGTSVSLGMSRFFQTGWANMPTWTTGVVVETADTEGANFRYDAINFNIDTTLQLSDRWSLLPSAGVGSRNYPDFTGTVDRDEITWRVGAKLRWQQSQHFAISLIAGHDRFASDNDQFDSERTQAGVIGTYHY